MKTQDRIARDGIRALCVADRLSLSDGELDSLERLIRKERAARVYERKLKELEEFKVGDRIQHKNFEYLYSDKLRWAYDKMRVGYFHGEVSQIDKEKFKIEVKWDEFASESSDVLRKLSFSAKEWISAPMLLLINREDLENEY